MPTSYFRTWAAYRKGFLLAKEIQASTENWPLQERFKLTDQIIRSSRSVCGSIGESFGKRMYPKHFVAKISDAISENYETQVWLDFALTNHYIDRPTYLKLIEASEEVGKLLFYIQKHPTHFAMKKPILK